MNIGKVSAGVFLIISVCGIGVGLALIGFGNGVISQVSDSGGGIEFAVGYMVIGAGYLVIAGSVVWAASTLIIATIGVLAHKARTKFGDRNKADTAAEQEIVDPNPKADSRLPKPLSDD